MTSLSSGLKSSQTELSWRLSHTEPSPCCKSNFRSLPCFAIFKLEKTWNSYLSRLSQRVYMGNLRYGDLWAATCWEKILYNTNVTNHPWPYGHHVNGCGCTPVLTQYTYASLRVAPSIRQSPWLRSISSRILLLVWVLVVGVSYPTNDNVSQWS
jgi:hypothetical protein